MCIRDRCCSGSLDSEQVLWFFLWGVHKFSLSVERGRQDTCSTKQAACKLICHTHTHTHTHTLQLSHAIGEGFIAAKNVDELLVVSDSPTELVDKLCLRWKTTAGNSGHAAEVM